MSEAIEPWEPNGHSSRIVSHAKQFIEKEHPVTVRQTFYHLQPSIIKNSESEYKKLIRILTKARKAGIIPFGWIVDLSRRPLIVNLYQDIKTFLKDKARFYYRDTWIKQPAYIVVWLEKQALQEIVWEVASQYNVPLFVGRGYASWDLIIKAAELLKVQRNNGKRLVILYFGDYDPSGEDMFRDLLERLQKLGIDAECHKIALTEDQVTKYNLPHQPVKTSDPRAKNFNSKFSVELDALEPSLLRELIKKTIEQHLDLCAFDADQKLESKEKSKLDKKLNEIADELEKDDEDDENSDKQDNGQK
jgi:hypothetical protein